MNVQQTFDEQLEQYRVRFRQLSESFSFELTQEQIERAFAKKERDDG